SGKGHLCTEVRQSKMAELEDVTLDGRPLHSLRVADLKAALEQRGLPKSGQKNALIKRLKGALMLENLQRTSTPHIGLQPNSQIGEEMSQNSFIKQYLAKQQELLRQRLEREAREAAEADGETSFSNHLSPHLAAYSLSLLHKALLHGLYVLPGRNPETACISLSVCAQKSTFSCAVQYVSLARYLKVIFSLSVTPGVTCHSLTPPPPPPPTASKPAAVSTMGSTSACTPVVPAQESPAEGECAGPGSRKRRWGSSTAVTAKKPSISITTDSLKSLIPDIKHTVSQEAVVDLHADEGHLSVEDDASERDERGGEDLDPGLTIRRTVTQVVLAESQENGQRDAKREEEAAQESKTLFLNVSFSYLLVVPSDMLVRRSISQQKSGVSVTIDDPVRSAKQPSPPRGNITNIIHICNLVRPFTLGQLKELLNRTGAMLEEGFWIDKIKSHCYVTYPSTEEAVATRTALHGVKWPQSNPKFLNVDFAQQDELDFHRGLLVPDQAREESGAPPPRPERDQWAEREREMERRERTRAEREWDRDKVRDFGKPSEERRSRSRDRERRRKERKEKKEKGPEEPPAKLLDDLFCKTKAAPCIYWLPLTEEQAAQREMERAERMKEREKRRKELQEEEDRKREEERKERMKAREKQAGPSTGAPSGSSRGTGDAERDQDKRREGHRSRAPGGSAGGQGSSRRSRSRSNPPGRDRRH
uniref:SAP domain-containing protein n=1 Tax=Scleropages formosus TaxID=113540 RepID=A0A8C9WS90_SCLFO